MKLLWLAAAAVLHALPAAAAAAAGGPGDDDFSSMLTPSSASTAAEAPPAGIEERLFVLQLTDRTDSAVQLEVENLSAAHYSVYGVRVAVSHNAGATWSAFAGAVSSGLSAMGGSVVSV